MRGESVESHTRALSLASPGRAGPKGADARHAREWSAEIRPLALRGCSYLLSFDFWFLGCYVYPNHRYKISTDRKIFVGE
jgi:hypothetical protein